VFFTELQAGLPPGLWHYFIDARTGAVLDQLNALDHLAEASGPGGNAKVARSWVNALDVEPSGGLYAMNNRAPADLRPRGGHLRRHDRRRSARQHRGRGDQATRMASPSRR